MVEKTKGNIGRVNKRKGSTAERRLAQLFRDIGYSFCKTSRQASRLLDDSKVDLAFIPYNVQSKCGYKKGLNYTTIFEDMEESLKKNFPPTEQVHKNPMIIFHDKGRKTSEKLVVMKENEFIELLKKVEIYDRK